MWRVGTGFSTSLDGFIAGPNDDVSEVFRWYAHGDTDLRFPGGRVSVRVSRASADLLQEMVRPRGPSSSGSATSTARTAGADITPPTTRSS